MSKRDRDKEIEEIEEVDSRADEEVVQQQCPCSMCSQGGLAKLEQLAEANGRVVHQLAKEVFDQKNAMFSLLNKLMTTVEEVQLAHKSLDIRTQEIAEIDKRTDRLGKAMKQLGSSGGNQVDIMKQLGTIQDLIVKGFASLNAK